MQETPAFLDASRPDVPDIVVAGGVTPFNLPNLPVRGRLIRLGRLADALLSRHDNHDAVSALAGRTLALAAGLATALKFRGSFSVQAKGDGPVGMLVSDCTDQGELRFYARADPDQLAEHLDRHTPPSDRTLLGDGYLAFTVDQGEHTDRHQGIVSIEGDSLADMAQHYFETSEQHACRVRLACARTGAGWRASALILERIATEGGIDGIAPDAPASNPAADDAWHTAITLAATLSDDELLDDTLSSEALLYRLFHAQGVRAEQPRALAYGCRCSRARLAGILEGFPVADLDHMDTDGEIVMTCEFCAYDFRFSRAAIGGIEPASDAPD